MMYAMRNLKITFAAGVFLRVCSVPAFGGQDGTFSAGGAVAAAGNRLSVVQEADAYNTWPMIEKIAGKIVCFYSRGRGHWYDGPRGAYVRTSSDRCFSWTPEICVTNDPAVCECAEGTGLDNGNALLMWMICSKGGRNRHRLYRTADGERFDFVCQPSFSPEPVQVTGIIPLPDGVLLSLWFAGNYRKAENGHSWGTLTSSDNGRSWVQRTVEGNLPRSEWPTEISAVSLGDGRILAIGRSERGTRRQFQLTSSDGGATWKKFRTNICDVNESTPSLIYDGKSGLVSNYYFQRGPGVLWRRTARAEEIFHSPGSWPEPEEVARGGRNRPYDSGNVKAVADGDLHHVAYYSGNATNTAVVVVSVRANPFETAR
jgi:hypothetical protein